MTDHINKDKIHRHSDTPLSKETGAKSVDDVIIQVTQAFCPAGHNLVNNQEKLFDGAPGISLHISDGKSQGDVILSPFHGDHRRRGTKDFQDGTKLEISCPVCHKPLPRLSSCSCSDHSDLFKIYLTPDLDDGHVVALCNVWGCHRSKVFDQAQLLASYGEETC